MMEFVLSPVLVSFKVANRLAGALPGTDCGPREMSLSLGPNGLSRLALLDRHSSVTPFLSIASLSILVSIPMRSLRFGLLLCLLANSLLAQQQGARPSTMTSELKRAGTYHLATGTWTSGESGVALTGPAQLYNNSCSVGLFQGFPSGSAVIDSGRIPSLDDGGLADAYEISCFEFAYCSFEPTVTTIDLTFVNCYAVCDDLAAAPVAGAFSLLNLPASIIPGVPGCWIVNVDLSNTTMTFNMGGNGDGVFDDVPSQDHFGWVWQQAIPTTVSNAGPVIAGDPLEQFSSSCGAVDPAGQGGGTWTGFDSALQGAGTDHPGWGFRSGTGTGIGTELDRYALDGVSGCFWFGGYGAGQNPLASFYLKLWGQSGASADSCGGTQSGPGNPICTGDTGNCPGGAMGGISSGCPHGAGPNGALGARLEPVGQASLSNDTLAFILTRGPSSFGIMIQGGVALGYPNGNAGIPDSAGLLCFSPQLRGSVVATNQGGASDEATIFDFQGQDFGITAQPVGQPSFYQFWFRDTGNPNANPGAGGEFNFSNGVEVLWNP